MYVQQFLPVTKMFSRSHGLSDSQPPNGSLLYPCISVTAQSSNVYVNISNITDTDACTRVSCLSFVETTITAQTWDSA
jgi:hypothetical protein